MESEIENHKLEIDHINKRIKEFLWKRRNWKENN